VIAGVLIVGGAAAFAVTQVASNDDNGSPVAKTPANQPSGDVGGGSDDNKGKRKKKDAVNPASVTVAVLNGTTVPGLAAQMGDRVEADGFSLGTVANSSDQQRAESVVLFSPGHEREAVAVGRKLGIAQREPVDPESQGLAGDATVVVIAGADRTR